MIRHIRLGYLGCTEKPRSMKTALVIALWALYSLGLPQAKAHACDTISSPSPCPEANGTGLPQACIGKDAVANQGQGDVNGDGVINILDILEVMINFGCTDVCGTADINEDGLVSVLDLQEILQWL